MLFLHLGYLSETTASVLNKLIPEKALCPERMALIISRLDYVSYEKRKFVKHLIQENRIDGKKRKEGNNQVKRIRTSVQLKTKQSSCIYTCIRLVNEQFI